MIILHRTTHTHAYTHTHTFTNVCQTDEIWISSVDCANINSLGFDILLYLSNMLSLEEKVWGTSMYLFATSCESVIIAK